MAKGELSGSQPVGERSSHRRFVEHRIVGVLQQAPNSACDERVACTKEGEGCDVFEMGIRV